jgi:hypothetical protein
MTQTHREPEEAFQDTNPRIAYDPHDTGVRLHPEEDAELRRLHMLRAFGAVAGTVSSRYEALRGRDRRLKVREPSETSLATPIEKSVWREEITSPRPSSPAQLPSVPPPSPSSSVPSSSSPTQRVISDTREIFGELPEPRRGRGVFRR